MKKLALSLLTIAALASCTAHHYSVKLRNGSIVDAVCTDSRTFKANDTVCLHLDALADWNISNNGEMKDTVMTYRLQDSSYYFSVYKIGIVK